MRNWLRQLRPTPEFKPVLIIWLVLTVIGTPLIVIFLGPVLPPGSASDSAHGQQQDNTVMTAIVWPIIAGLVVYFIYCFVKFRTREDIRDRPEPVQDGPPTRGSNVVMGTWIVVTGIIIIFLATWGSVELFPGERGAGGGQGPHPLAVATPSASHMLPVQVIGQQWEWTFRWPTYGGVETTQLELPVNREVKFEVTSIDVIHSFWAIQLGVKADAVPSENNIAFTKPVKLGRFDVRCAELCGLWHGHMATHGRVVSDSAFKSWITRQEREWAPATKFLPPMKKTYHPQPDYRAS